MELIQRLVALAAALLVIVGLPIAAPGQSGGDYRAVYVPSFDLNTRAKCDAIIADILGSNINSVFIQVRSRGDAYYYPNRTDSTYPNPEPRAQLYALSPADFDPLQYFIDAMHNATPRREVHAWLTTFNIWNRGTNPPSADHVYNRHPEWVTYRRDGSQFTPGTDDDIPLDPGLVEVQDYVYNVYMDIVRNYDIDGLHFDYIRLLSSDSGFHPGAKARFLEETGWNYDTQNTGTRGALANAYNLWRRDQITQLVERVYRQTMLEKPWVNVSAFLVNYTDSLENLGQGYTWWVTYDAIDALHIGAYASTVSTTVSRYNFMADKLAQNNNHFKRPLVAATGAYLMEDRDTADGQTRHTHAIRDLLNQPRRPNGFNFFAHRAMFNGTNTPRDLLARELFTGTGPLSTYVPPPVMDHKNAIGQEFTPPNAAANFIVQAGANGPTISFQRPTPAADGDLPVRYRLYRSTNASVPLVYTNQIMEWWDVTSSRSQFSFTDKSAPTGTVHYRLSAYDDWNNRALSPIRSVTNNATLVYIIETRAGGLNFSDYSDFGVFTDSTSHSTASGLTPGLGSRFALPGDTNGRNDRARFTPSGLSAGTYSVDVTSFNFGSANALGITVRFNSADGVSTTNFDLTSAVAGNSWASVGTIRITPGLGHFVEFDNATQTNIGNSTNSRMNAAAVRFTRLDTGATGPEFMPEVRQPRADFPVGGTIVIDSHPRSLNYEDATASGGWLTSTLAGYFNSNARYYQPANYPVTDYAIWVVDLPRAGRWAIDGWVRNNNVFATGAQYRFRDGNGVLRNTIVNQQAPPDNTNTGGWFINVDGVSNQNAHFFNAGRMYITLYGNTGGNQFLIADALRFTLIEAAASDADGEDGWFMY